MAKKKKCAPAPVKKKTKAVARVKVPGRTTRVIKKGGVTMLHRGSLGMVHGFSVNGTARVDGGVRAPKTARVVPVDKLQTTWRAECYSCTREDYASSRKDVIEQHLRHYKKEHAEC